MGITPGRESLLRILDQARWAPSGDNTQPWRFEISGDRNLLVHGSDTRRNVLYDRQGFASQIATGVLLEHIAIAASAFGLKALITCRTNDPDDEHPLYDVRFSDDSALLPDPLLPLLEKRCVNRRPLGTAPLTSVEKEKIMRGMVDRDTGLSSYRILWLEKFSDRVSMARITQSSGKLRLIIPETYPVHRAVIEWNARYSLDRIPDQALGLPLDILPLMRWIMGSWERVSFFNRFLGGTLIPRLELDILPALFCSAHFVLLAPRSPQTLTDHIEAGRALCRFWLGVAALGLQFQPEMTPLIFRSYADRNQSFSQRSGSLDHARKIARALEQLIGEEHAGQAIFLGRVGRGAFPRSRSLRLPLSSLLLSP